MCFRSLHPNCFQMQLIVLVAFKSYYWMRFTLLKFSLAVGPRSCTCCPPRFFVQAGSMGFAGREREREERQRSVTSSFFHARRSNGVLMR